MRALEGVEELIAEADSRRKILAKLVKDLKSTKTSRGWDAISVARVLEAAGSTETWDVHLKALLDAARSSAKRDASRAFLELEADIREICTRNGWAMDGQWPKLYIARAVAFEVDERKRAISVDGSRVEAGTPEEIEKALDREIKDLVPSAFSAERFMDSLAAAYDSVAVGGQREAPIIAVYCELVVQMQSAGWLRDARARTFSELRSVQFRARLTAALERGVHAASDGRELRLLPPIDPKDALFIYQPGEKRFGFVGRIEFRQMGAVAG